MKSRTYFVTSRIRTFFAIFLALLAVSQSLQSATAQEKTVALHFSPEIDDYAPVVTAALNEIYDAGGGTLQVGYGRYPLKTVMGFSRRDAKTVSITIQGVKNAAGERPLFYCVAEPGKTHRMFNFGGGWFTEGGYLSVSVSSIEIVGNNVPVNRSTSNVPGDDGVSPPWAIIPWGNQPDDRHYGHPFMHHTSQNGDAIILNNLKTAHIDDVIIREVYGDGIKMANYGTRSDEWMIEPTITNTRILNTWLWQDGFITGDGIIAWFVKKPRIENCVIYNDIPYTRWTGRSGIVIEHDSEEAIIRNNVIGGYVRNIHIENTYGGHVIENNKLLASDFGVFLNEPEWGDAAKMAKVKPVAVKDNYFEYNMERITYKAFPMGGRRALVDTFILSKKLNGLQVTGNEFVINDGGPHPKDPLVYIGPVEAKDYAAHGFTVQNNMFN